jgi:hypothetical protein
MATKRNLSKPKRQNNGKPSKEKAVRVRWSPEEQQKIISTAAEALLNKSVFTHREALNFAIAAMPKDRQREILAMSQVPWFVNGVPARLKELERQHHQSVEQVIAQTADQAAAKARAEALEEMIQQAGAILGRILAVAFQYVELPKQEVRSSPVGKHNPFGKTEAREVRPRVIVAGTLPAQSKSIEEAFGAKLDLRFWTKDQSSDTLKSMLSHADHAVGMVGFLSHAHDNILKSSRVPYTPVSGGVSQVKQTLEKLI